MAEDNFSDVQFEEELLEFNRRLSQKSDQIEDRFCEKMDKIGEKMDEFSDRMRDRMGECIGLLHQALRDQGLTVPPKSTPVPAKVASPPLEPLRSTTRVDLGSKLVLQSSPFPSFTVKDDDLQREVQEEQLPIPYVAKRELVRPIRHLEVHPKDHAVKLGEVLIFNLQNLAAKGVDMFDFDGKTIRVNDYHEQYCIFRGVLEAKSDAHKLFEEMPEPIPMLKMFSGDIFGISVDERLIKYGFVSMIFDPGGENHKRLAEFEKQFGENCKFKSVDTRFAQAESEDDNQLEGNSENVQNMVNTHYASKLLDEMSIRNLESVLLAKITAGSLGEESSCGEFFVHLSLVPRFVFDPGGQEGIEMDVQAEIEGLDFAIVQWDPGGLLLNWAQLLVQPWRTFVFRDLDTNGWRYNEVVEVSPWPFQSQRDAKSMCAADFHHGHFLFKRQWWRHLFLEEFSHKHLRHQHKELEFIVIKLTMSSAEIMLKLLPIYWDPGGLAPAYFRFKTSEDCCNFVVTEEVSFAKWTHLAVDFILGSWKNLLSVGNDTVLIQATVNSLVVRLVKKMSYRILEVSRVQGISYCKFCITFS